MEAKTLTSETADIKPDFKNKNMFVESGMTETLDPEDEKKLIRKIDLR
jgi:hypothetical protein